MKSHCDRLSKFFIALVTFFVVNVQAQDNRKLEIPKISQSQISILDMSDFRKQLQAQPRSVSIDGEKLKIDFLRNSSKLRRQGGADAGGADPKAIVAQSFPNEAKLREILELIATNVLKSGYPPAFQSEILSEILS